MKVAHIFTVSDSLVFLRGQMAFMKANGIELTIFCSPSPALEAFGRVEEALTVGIPMARAITPFADLDAVRRLGTALRRWKPDVVHAHTPKGGLLGMLAATMARVPGRIYHMRGLPFTTANGWRRQLLVQTERVSCGLADRVLCVSHSLRRTALANGISSADKLRVIAGGSGNGVNADGHFHLGALDPDVRAVTRGRLGIPRGAFVVGYVGRLARDKGVVELDRAWSRLSIDAPQARLLLVGDHDSRDGVTAEQIPTLTSATSVVRTGQVRDVRPFYAAMDLLVLPTYREGFPNVLLEAGAMELPVVTTEVDGCVDAVLAGRTGALVPARDSEALALAIASYLAEPSAARAHGRAAREHVLANFAQQRIWQGILDTYRELSVAGQK